MRNFLKVQPEDYLKEREIGRTSFVIKRAIIFVILIISLQLLALFFIDFELSGGQIVIITIFGGFGLAINEWASLEYNYWKTERKKK